MTMALRDADSGFLAHNIFPGIERKPAFLRGVERPLACVEGGATTWPDTNNCEILKPPPRNATKELIFSWARFLLFWWAKAAVS